MCVCVYVCMCVCVYVCMCVCVYVCTCVLLIPLESVQATMCVCVPHQDRVRVSGNTISPALEQGNTFAGTLPERRAYRGMVRRPQSWKRTASMHPFVRKWCRGSPGLAGPEAGKSGPLHENQFKLVRVNLRLEKCNSVLGRYCYYPF